MTRLLSVGAETSCFKANIAGPEASVTFACVRSGRATTQAEQVDLILLGRERNVLHATSHHDAPPERRQVAHDFTDPSWSSA
jgi:hypothetical protein